MNRLIFLATLILGLAACGGNEAKNTSQGISVSGSVVQVGGTECAISHNPIRQLRECGLSSSQRERALALLLMEKNQRLIDAKEKLGRLQPSKQELLWTARTMYVESTMSTYEMSLIGTVIRNRVQSKRWADNAEDVVRSNWQFTGVHRAERGVTDLTLRQYHSGDGLTLRQHSKWRRAVRTAYGVLSWPRRLLPLEATHYVNLDAVSKRPEWAHRRPDYKTESHSYYTLN